MSIPVYGKCYVYGNDVNTDLIIAGKYTKSLNVQDFVDHCMEDIDANFKSTVKPGDIVIAGENFGCGSSREQAPLALKYSGIRAVIAKSFARIFYRNAINIGLQVIVCDTSSITSEDIVEIDDKAAQITVNRIDKRPYAPIPPVMQDILDCGGLIPYLRKYGQFHIQEIFD